MQAPVAVHVSEVMPQSWHVDPPSPHWPDVVGVTQVVPEQHPVFWHELESQTQLWLTQACPLTHCAFVPQRQTPVEQLSANVVMHVKHVAASIPHVGNGDVSQLFPLQHPSGHDVVSQTQLPPEQSWPAAHATFVPHRHAPVFEQLSAVVVSHPVQASPPTPQVASVEGSQLAPAQQPPGQFAAVQPVHTPPAQFWLVGHGSHDDPLAPHCAVVLPGRHWPLEVQQPVGHEVTLQAQLPFAQI